MRRYTKKTHYRTSIIIQISLLLILPLRCFSVNGQIPHHTDYEIAAAGRRNGVTASDSSEDEAISNQSSGIHTNGEILGPKSFPLSAQEPSCEELRAMWIFSKRQSRAAEMSNEIPTYRDPFAYNVWEPMYPQGRNMGSRTISHYREPSRPVFGRVISREPVVLQRLPAVRTRVFDDVPRMYGSESRSAIPSLNTGVGPRRYMQYRFSGTPYGGSSAAAANANTNAQNLVHQGSFQKLKELIWTERAKELTQQRKAEELAARAAALKDISAGQFLNTQPEQNDEPMPNEQNLSPDQEQHYHHNTDSRMSIANSQQQGIIKSIFSGNPANSNSARSGRLLLPSIGANDARERANLQRNFPMRPSHFRERNRVLFRQSTPSDYYQRESRSEQAKPSQGIPYEEQLNMNSRLYNSANDRGITDTSDNNNNNQYHDIIPYLKDLQSTRMQQQLNDLFQKLYQPDDHTSFSSFLTLNPSLQRKPSYHDDSIETERISRDRRYALSNEYSKHPLSSDSY